MDQNQLVISVIQALIDSNDGDGRGGRRRPPRSPFEFLRVMAMFQRSLVSMPLPLVGDTERARIANMIRDVADDVERSGKHVMPIT
jgi:hypothetical protein